MSGSGLIALEALLVLVSVFGFGAWELYSLRRDRRRDEASRDAAAAKPGGDARDDTRTEARTQR